MEFLLYPTFYNPVRLRIFTSSRYLATSHNLTALAHHQFETRNRKFVSSWSLEALFENHINPRAQGKEKKTNKQNIENNNI